MAGWNVFELRGAVGWKVSEGGGRVLMPCEMSLDMAGWNMFELPDAMGWKVSEGGGGKSAHATRDVIIHGGLKRD